MWPLKWKKREQEYRRQREEFFEAVKRLNRRDFLKIASLSAAVFTAKHVVPPHSFQVVDVVRADPQEKPLFRFAYISDTHLYERELNERFVNAALRAVRDVNALNPPPDFVIFGGDLAQLGQAKELELGKQILSELKVPVKMMVGEHDWFLDMGEKWRELFGPENYSFDHKGVHFIVLMSVHEKDFWTARGMTPMERMLTVAQLDNPLQSPFEVGEAGREWLRRDLAKVSKDTPIIIFSHSPLYKYYRPWNFWTEDAEEIHKMLAPFKSVTVIHGHTHQLLTNRIQNIHFHGMLATAWPWPYAPEGLPKLTVPMNRPDPFDEADGTGWGTVDVHRDGYVDKHYNLWSRNPITVAKAYLESWGKEAIPPAPELPPY
ncbi:MAG: metallophosphoesterase [Blastocatellia bacterium]|nr:metallophosphoesterase [Blastocatellia bacterium]MCS7156730.1 metallophosphoesterase [Blastocatellia bacterium]MCX7751528.1 metallophosphoesterase [Blastocatellia bacterium]MDW8168628.1 metallophosphoesterase [Acidobacteriota bacterium]MDW8256523.1 metallophosphoesterase [Acidobacteriota bacterium]